MEQRANADWNWVWPAVFASLLGAIGISIALFPSPPQIDIAIETPQPGPT